VKKRSVRKRGRKYSVRLSRDIPQHQRRYQTQRRIRKQLQKHVENEREDVDGDHRASGERQLLILGGKRRRRRRAVTVRPVHPLGRVVAVVVVVVLVWEEKRERERERETEREKEQQLFLRSFSSPFLSKNDE